MNTFSWYHIVSIYRYQPTSLGIRTVTSSGHTTRQLHGMNLTSDTSRLAVTADNGFRPDYQLA